MRHFIRCILSAVAAMCFAAVAGKASAVVLADGGEPKAVIVTADNPPHSTLQAVDELNYWLNRISGVALPVIPFSQWDGAGVFVAVGESPLTHAKGWSGEPFAQEEARVFITDEGVGLLGNDASPFPGVRWTGTYYAVLEFLKKELGARWIWPGPTGEVFEPRARVEVSPAQWTWAPDLTLIRTMYNPWRGTFGRQTLESLRDNFGVVPDPERWEEFVQMHDNWLKRQRMNRSSNVRIIHTFVDWWDKYSKDHPDWFARPPEGLTQHGGHGVKLNKSNPEVIDRIVADWKSAWEKDRKRNLFLSVGPNDSRGFDTRPETRAMDAPQMQSLPEKEIYNGSEAVLTDRYVKFWNEIARRVAAIDPEATVGSYAYRNYQKPPLDENLQLEPNVVIAYVGGEGFYPDEPHIRTEWDGWAKHGARQMIWRPNLMQSGHGMPYDFSRQLFDDFKFLRERNMRGVEYDSLVSNWYGQGLSYYIATEMQSRPEATYDELAGEYFAAFGPAAQSVRDFYAYFAEQTKRGPSLLRESGTVERLTWGGWWRGYIRIVSEMLTPDVLAEGSRLLKQAQADVADSNPVYRERVDLLVRGFTHAELMANAFRELNLKDPLAKPTKEASRKALQPLWDFRMAHMPDLSTATAIQMLHEQRGLKLWDAFVKSDEAPRGQRTWVLTDGWRLKADPANVGLRERWQDARSFADWDSVAVGKPWRLALPSLPDTRIAWYVLEFEVPELEDTGQTVHLNFSSVDAETRLWVNGVQLDERGYPHRGNYDSWAEPFSLNITPAIRGGAKNLLVLRVESDQRNGGITGPVVLRVGK